MCNLVSCDLCCHINSMYHLLYSFPSVLCPLHSFSQLIIVHWAINLPTGFKPNHFTENRPSPTSVEMHVNNTLKSLVPLLALFNPLFTECTSSDIIFNVSRVESYKDVIHDIHFDIDHEFIAHFDPIVSRHVWA